MIIFQQKNNLFGKEDNCIQVLPILSVVVEGIIFLSAILKVLYFSIKILHILLLLTKDKFSKLILNQIPRNYFSQIGKSCARKEKKLTLYDKTYKANFVQCFHANFCAESALTFQYELQRKNSEFYFHLFHREVISKENLALPRVPIDVLQAKLIKKTNGYANILISPKSSCIKFYRLLQ